MSPTVAAAASSSTAAATRLTGLVEARLERKGRLGKYTMAEVAKHNQPADAWIVLRGRVSWAHPPSCAPLESAHSCMGGVLAVLPSCFGSLPFLMPSYAFNLACRCTTSRTMYLHTLGGPPAAARRSC